MFHGTLIIMIGVTEITLTVTKIMPLQFIIAGYSCSQVHIFYMNSLPLPGSDSWLEFLSEDYEAATSVPCPAKMSW